jgi:hypothetical protein
MPQLISDAYQKLNYDLHKSDETYGTSADANIATGIRNVAKQHACRTLLDYGCGKGTLKIALQPLFPELDIREYDPARPGKTQLPEPADFVACLDVMEHIEPENLDAVLDHIRSLTKRIALFLIAIAPAKKSLADGRNAHLTVQPQAWWVERLSARFKVLETRPIADGQEFLALLQALPPQKV